MVCAQKHGDPPNMLLVIQKLRDGMQASIISGSTLTEQLEVHNGAKQGCCLAPLLFNIYAAPGPRSGATSIHLASV